MKYCRAGLLGLFISLVVASAQASAPLTNASWRSLGVFAGTGGEVSAVAVHGADIYVGGSFITAGNVLANYVAHWDGSAWHAMGTGMDKPVLALAVDSAGNVYAGGIFTTAGGITVNHVARWDGSTWNALGSGTDSVVLSLAVDSHDVLYAGGNFVTAGGVTVQYLASWNGSGWSAVGGGMNGLVSTLAIDSTDAVFAGGSFTVVGAMNVSGSLAANRIARWNGKQWSAFAGGLNNSVYTMAVVSSGNVFVGGNFTYANGVAAPYIAHWDGSGWSPVGKNINAYVYSLAYDKKTQALYVGGSFNVPIIGKTQSLVHVAKWSGSLWTALASGLAGNVNALAIDGGGNVVAGGDFTGAIAGVASWNGKQWNAYNPGSLDGRVNAVAVDSQGHVYIGGDFLSANGTTLNRVAEWNGSQWTALASGFDDSVRALATDSKGNLYAGGYFHYANGHAIKYLAMWNGTDWVAVGDPLDDIVYALCVDAADKLYVGGTFRNAGAQPVGHVVKWDGVEWVQQGSGVDGIVYTLAVDSTGNVYAGGHFQNAGGVAANSIAYWNGSSWSALGSGMDNTVQAVTVDSTGKLFAGGLFSTAGGVTVNHVAMWNGSSWSGFGNGADALVYTLAADVSGHVYAGGEFTNIDGIVVNHIARWDGSTWAALGSGMDPDGVVHAAAVDPLTGNAYVGGDFMVAGDKVASFAAEWMLDSDGDGVPDLQDCYPTDPTQSACASGYYATGSGFALAPAGNYATGNGDLTKCPAGTYNPNTGSSSISACIADPVGSISFAGSATYGPAPSGGYASGGVFVPCPAGTYNPSSGATSVAACMPVPAGSYAYEGASSPTACAVGTYTSSTGNAWCVLATPGFYVATTGAAAPTPCAAGFYSGYGATSCSNDVDGDGIVNSLDNCPLMPNSTQTDSNNNGVGDVCDLNANGVGVDANSHLGTSVVLADMNGDGIADVIIGIPDKNSVVAVNNIAKTMTKGGVIKIISGANGNVLLDMEGNAPARHLGSAIAVVPDQDGDGIPDLAIGIPLADVTTSVGGKTVILRHAGNVSIYSGSDGSLIRSIANGSVAGQHFGAALASGDLDGDSIPDLVVGAPLCNVTTTVSGKAVTLRGVGCVTVYSGTSNTVLYTRQGNQAGEHFGAAVGVDVSTHQLLVGSPDYVDTVTSGTTMVKHTKAGRVQLFNGSDGVSVALQTIVGADAGDRLGAAVSSFSQDKDGDGYDDWAVGVPGLAIMNTSTGKLMPQAGRVEFFSGTSATPLAQHVDGAASGDNFGAAISVVADFSADGRNDLAIGSPRHNGTTYVDSKPRPLAGAGMVELINSNQLF